jgi:mono/diheme cytochrome c family protein
VLVWVLFALLLFPVGFAGWAVGHYTSLGKSTGTRTVTETATVTTTVTTAVSTPASTTAAATTAAATTTAGVTGAGDVAKGKAVFLASGCGSCHTFKSAGTSGTVGPDLDTAVLADSKRDQLGLSAFIHESIVDPNAYVPTGYPKGVMPTTFGTQLSSTQLTDLVAFLAAGAK